MDILGILQNKTLSTIIIFGGAIVFGILYVVGRLIYSSIFGSKSKSFEDEANEHTNQPLYSGSESIGSVSIRLGEDLRDVWEKGYSDDQINGVLTGKYSLEELYTRDPQGNTSSTKGKEILAKNS